MSPRSRSRSRAARLAVEQLETRDVPTTFTPAQLVHAYGFDQVSFLADNYNGTAGLGQTIAIVDSFDDPNIATDLHTFDTRYSLPDPVFTKATPQGLPASNANWAMEIALDVEWAHAIAPAANILLVEANGDTDTAILAAVDYAANYHDPVTGQGVAAVSMSWGFNEFTAETDAAHDAHFTGHPGVTFVGASGDSGKPPIWPATSPNVLAVGGTNLTLTTVNNWSSEKGWGSGNLSFLFGGSGGGISKYEPKPTYQSAVTQSSTKRTSPDIAYDADPATGVSVYDSMNGGWLTVGGTSAGAPQWAALMGIADQGRALAGKTSLGSPDTLSAVYTMPATNFHDITSGNNGYAATTGYDLVTGRGTPKANLVVNYLVSTATSAPAAAPASSGGTGTSAAPAGQQVVAATPHAAVMVRVQPAAPAGAATVAPAVAAVAPGSPVAGPAPVLAPAALPPAPAAGNLVVTFESGRPVSDDPRPAAAPDPVPVGPAGPNVGGTVGAGGVIVGVPDDGEAPPDGLE